MATIQELLANNPSGDSQPTHYVNTVEAYNKWAEVCIFLSISSLENYLLAILSSDTNTN